jgi:hypothetical protein
MNRLALLIWVASTPLAAATFTVTNTNDSGPGSLRQAILDANANPGLDTIAFDIPGAGVHTISPSSNLDTITDPVVIDGYSQPGSSVNTDPVGTNAVLRIELDGTIVGGGFSLGLNLAAPGCTVQGLVVNGWGSGIRTFGTGGNVIRGNFLGTDPTGTVAKPNGTAIGISASNDLVGGTSPADRNLVSGNTAGTFGGAIEIGGAANATIQGNLVGTDASGLLAVPNGDGIYSNMPATIGGASPGAGNVISGNSLDGLFVQAAVVIQGNKIGIGADGVTPLGNGSQGVDIHESSGASIGGIGAGEANVIADNRSSGVLVSSSGVHNLIRGNSIFGNGIGIDLNGDGPSPNDAGDADNGANNLQNYPIIQSLTTGATTHVVAKFRSVASTTYDLDWYVNPACSRFPRELLQGETYVLSTQVTTDDVGNATIDADLPFATQAGERVTVTASDPAGNTSEFAQRIVFSISPSSGPPTGGTQIGVSGTDFSNPTEVTFGAVPAADVTFQSDSSLLATSPALAPGTVSDVVVTTSDGTTGTLVKGWVSDFLDVPNGHPFYSFVTTLVSNAITVGVGGGNYGVDQPTLRQQMAVFLLKAKHGLCYTPPPCQGDFQDVACPSTFADWVEALADEGISGGCGNGNFCPANPVRRDQMAPFLLKAEHGSGYVPPACAGAFTDVACPSLFADWIEQLAAEGITGGCGGGNYCPSNDSTRGQMAVFVVKTFDLQ